MNRITLKGRIGSDLDLKKLGQKETSFLSFSLADSYKAWENGGPTNRTIWHKCKAWGKVAETIANYLSKGDNVLLFGKMVQEEYKDNKTGENKKISVIMIDSMEFLESSNNKKEGGNQQSYSNQKYNRSNQKEEDPFIEDDIPF